MEEESGYIELGKPNSSVAVGQKRVRINLGWDPNVESEMVHDLDLSCAILNSSRELESAGDLIFYGNRISKDGSVVHSSDDGTGHRSQGGPDEWIDLDLFYLPRAINEILFVVSVYNHEKTTISLAEADNVFLEIKNDVSQARIHHKKIEGSDFVGKHCFEVGSLIRESNGSDWKFVVSGRTYQKGLEAIIETYSSLNWAYRVASENKPVIDMNATFARRAQPEKE